LEARTAQTAASVIATLLACTCGGAVLGLRAGSGDTESGGRVADLAVLAEAVGLAARTAAAIVAALAILATGDTVTHILALPIGREHVLLTGNRKGRRQEEHTQNQELLHLYLHQSTRFPRGPGHYGQNRSPLISYINKRRSQKPEQRSAGKRFPFVSKKHSQNGSKKTEIYKGHKSCYRLEPLNMETNLARYFKIYPHRSAAQSRKP
jgi:hypothetical protein